MIRQPAAYKTAALPIELYRHIKELTRSSIILILQTMNNKYIQGVGETGFEPAMILGPKPSAFDHWATPLNKIEVRLGITPNTSTSFN